NEAISTSNNYTDNKISESNTIINQNIDNAKNEAISTSNNYTDNKVNENNTIINNNITNASENAYNRSVDYTDSVVNKNNNYIIEKSQSYTDNRFNESVNYTDEQIKNVNNRMNSLNNKVDKNRKLASAGIAGAMAMSAIPQNFAYNFSFGMGMASFDSEQAISAGGYYRINERTTVSLKTSLDTQNKLGTAAGISYGW
ncbi:hypothetical protein EC412_23940, partial [Salmonella enterica subsp. enterica serovar Redlands]|nr:hypothetical protein [Salmonella enterica subsp. enterica serovar Redlands]